MKCNTTIRFLRDIADIQTGPFGSQLHKEDYVEYGTPIVTVEHLGNRKFTEQNLPKVSDSDKERLKKYVLATGDIVFSRVGSVDRCSYVDEEHNGWMFSGRCLRVRPSENIDSLYLYYYFCREETRQFVRNIAVGATMPSINTKLLGEVPVAVPDLQIQKMVSNILSTIDNKIELNNKINANLQQQAFCIFEKLLTEVSGESILVSDIADLNPKRALTKNQIAKCIDMAQLSTSGAFPDGWVDKPFKGGMRFANGDTLLARITPCLENGKTAFIDFLNEGEVAFGSTEYIVLSPKEGIPPEFLYCLARYPAFVDYAVKNMNGSSGRQRVSAETIGQYSLPRLSDEQYQTFGELASPMFRKMKNNWMENMRLANVRDTLLPKLMAREIDISNFERSSSEKTSKEKRRFE